jgi:hypothetical protein
MDATAYHHAPEYTRGRVQSIWCANRRWHVTPHPLPIYATTRIRSRRNSGAKSAPFGQAIVPISESTATRAKYSRIADRLEELSPDLCRKVDVSHAAVVETEPEHEVAAVSHASHVEHRLLQRWDWHQRSVITGAIPHHATRRPSARATSWRLAPTASNPRISSSRDTLGSPASSFATRD